jgi:hypothetical protein
LSFYFSNGQKYSLTKGKFFFSLAFSLQPPPPPPRLSAITLREEGWPPAIPPPHVSFAPSSSYLLDALVPVSLPFFFLFPLPFFFSCFRLFSFLWSSGSQRFRSPAACGRSYAHPHRAFLPSPPSSAMLLARSCPNLFC